MPLATFRRSRAPRAFTLLELLIALTISAIVALSLFTALHVVFKARENVMADVAPIGSAELAMEMIRTDLQAVQPAAPSTTTTSGLVGGGISSATNTNQPLIGPFEGQQGGGNGGDGLFFYSNGFAPDHQSGIGEIKQVGFTLEQRNNTQCLVRQVWGNLLSQTTLDPDEEVICRYVRSFTLQYYDGTQWQTSWDSTQYNNSLPVAVQVTLDTQPPNVKQVIHMQRVYLLSCLTPPTAATTATQ